MCCATPKPVNWLGGASLPLSSRLAIASGTSNEEGEGVWPVKGLITEAADAASQSNKTTHNKGVDRMDSYSQVARLPVVRLPWDV